MRHPFAIYIHDAISTLVICQSGYLGIWFTEKQSVDEVKIKQKTGKYVPVPCEIDCLGKLSPK